MVTIMRRREVMVETWKVASVIFRRRNFPANALSRDLIDRRKFHRPSSIFLPLFHKNLPYYILQLSYIMLPSAAELVARFLRANGYTEV